MSALPPKGEIRQRSDLMSFRIALEGQVVQVVLGLDRLNRLSVNYRRGRLVLGTVYGSPAFQPHCLQNGTG